MSATRMVCNMAATAAFFAATATANAGAVSFPAKDASASISLSNAAMRVEINESDGALKSLVLNGDEAKMNWVEGRKPWGLVRAYAPCSSPRRRWDFCDLHYLLFQGVSRSGDVVKSRYSGNGLSCAVTRTIEKDALFEQYEFRNEGGVPLYFLRGHLGILATFNDSYGSADECAIRRCHAHIHANGTNAFVHAVKMAPYPVELVLSMAEGELDGYSQQICQAERSNDRGDIVLHPAPFVLLPGDAKRFSWRISAIPAGSFVPPVRVKYETCFPGEKFEISDVAGRHLVDAVRPGKLEAHGARLYVSEPLEEIVRRRIDFIVSHQQCRDSKSPLYGAFLIYDTEDRLQYFDDRWFDHNACRERLGMGLLIARWLQSHDDQRVREAFGLFEEFVFREFVDRDTGITYNTVGKNPNRKRLYNAPWAMTFLGELYRLKGDVSYLRTAERAMMDYYANGGEKFYPNGCRFGDLIAMMRDAGLDVSNVLACHRRHIDRILANGVNYPPHEVRYEQTIVTPAVSILCSYWLNIEKDPKVRAAIDEHVAMLTRFDGEQPDHASGGMPIRHWDGYWFGKLRSYGDTLHYWSVLSAAAYKRYAEVSGDRSYDERAERCWRNTLFLYRGDGTASCAYYVPLFMSLTDDGGEDIGPVVRGERFDPWANDQDFGLYFMLRDWR